MANPLGQITQGMAGKSAPKTDAYSKTFYGKTGDETIASGGEADKKSEEQRKSNYDDMVKTYYDQATDFYEYGWGQSFHFAPIRSNEAFSESQARHQHRLALKVKADRGVKILDVGCGVGGPGREIAQISGANVVGVTINSYQVDRATRLTQNQGLSSQCSFVEADFHHLPFEDNSFDGAYACEATCHSPNLSDVYGEICRVIKPGTCFACYEWIVTDTYDVAKKSHHGAIHNLLEGNGLPGLCTQDQVKEAVQKAGLDLIEMEDLALTSAVPWYSPLTFGKDIAKSVFRATAIGRKTTQAMLIGMEALGRAPKGMSKTHAMLCRGADGLVEGGKMGIFTPMLFFVARKPMEFIA